MCTAAVVRHAMNAGSDGPWPNGRCCMRETAGTSAVWCNARQRVAALQSAMQVQRL